MKFGHQAISCKKPDGPHSQCWEWQRSSRLHEATDNNINNMIQSEHKLPKEYLTDSSNEIGSRFSNCDDDSPNAVLILFILSASLVVRGRKSIFSGDLGGVNGVFSHRTSLKIIARFRAGRQLELKKTTRLSKPCT